MAMLNHYINRSKRLALERFIGGGPEEVKDDAEDGPQQEVERAVRVVSEDKRKLELE